MAQDPEIASGESVARFAAPRLRRIDIQIQASNGAAAFTDSSGILVLLLRANNTGLTLDNAERGQMTVFVVQQGVGGGFTWTAAPTMKLAGGSKGTTATVPGHRDIYTFIFDGTDWCEIARALDVG